MTETIGPWRLGLISSSWLGRLSIRRRAEGVHLVGEGGPLAGLTKAVVETALEEELSDHLGHDTHDPAGRSGGISRNGTRARRAD